MMKILMMVVMLAAMMVPVQAKAAADFSGITFATSYYNQPVSNTGGTSVSARLPFGTLPSPWEAVFGKKLMPQALEDRLYYGLGGTPSASGPGVQPSPTALQLGLGYKFHELLGASAGLSRYEFRGDTSNVFFWSIDGDFRLIEALLAKVTGS